MHRNVLVALLSILSIAQIGYGQESEVLKPSPTSAKNSMLPVDTMGYSIREIRTEPLPKRARVIPSPSGDIVAVVTREQTLFYYLNANTCTGPDIVGKGESTSSEAASRALQESADFNIFPQWQKSVGGEDVFILDIGEKTGVRLSNGKWVEASTTRPLNRLGRAKLNHQHRKIGARDSTCLLEPVLTARARSREKSPRNTMQYKINMRAKQIEDAEDKDAITINGILRIHPEFDRAIVSTNDYPYGGNMVYVDLETGVAKELTSNRSLTGTRGNSRVQFSPDGRWILVTLNLGPDEHETGGYLQLFDLDGGFVEELAIFPDDVYSPAGRAHWLPNDWIVYDDHKEIHFLKYTSE